MGYHKKEIAKGIFGDFSKIQEEIEELLDAHEQGATIMELCEMSDLIGAMAGYAKKYHNITLEDLITMHTLTSAAFKDGSRK